MDIPPTIAAPQVLKIALRKACPKGAFGAAWKILELHLGGRAVLEKNRVPSGKLT